MRTATINPCSRCGKERIVSKTWKEKIQTSFGDSMVVFTENICPDKECQKVVDKELAAQKRSRDKIKSDKEAKLASNKIAKAKAGRKALKISLKKKKK